MTDKQFKLIEELALKKLAEGFTKEEALASLQSAGILDGKGEFTAPYQNLGRYIASAKKK